MFDAYASTLPSLGAGDEALVQSALRAFELILLKEVGVLPDLSLVTLTQQPVSEGGRYALLPEAGVAAPRGGEGELSGEALIGAQAALNHGSLSALQHACASALPALKVALRNLLHYHLGSSLLRTRQVMMEVQSLDR